MLKVQRLIQRIKIGSSVILASQWMYFCVLLNWIHNNVPGNTHNLNGERILLELWFCPSFILFPHLTMTCMPFLSPPSPSLSPHPLRPSFHPLFAQPPHLNSPLHLVTMQIYLSPLTRKTGSSEDAKLAARVPTSSGSTAKPHAKGGSKPQGRKTPPSFALNLQKRTNSQPTVQDECVYKSPVKSPSQYFQICY